MLDFTSDIELLEHIMTNIISAIISIKRGTAKIERKKERHKYKGTKHAGTCTCTSLNQIDHIMTRHDMSSNVTMVN